MDKGTVLYGVDPLILLDHYEIDYHHSYAQDSPFFVGLTKGQLLGSRCTVCGYTYATPRAHCMGCGAATSWLALPLTGRVHTFTTCHYGGEVFLKETPFTLILVEFDGADTLFLSRLKGIRPDAVRIGLTVIARFAKAPALSVWVNSSRGRVFEGFSRSSTSRRCLKWSKNHDPSPTSSGKRKMFQAGSRETSKTIDQDTRDSSTEEVINHGIVYR